MKAIDLFSGPGGLTLGMKAAGIEPICSVERKKDAVDTYCGHTPHIDHFCEDIRKIDFSPYKGKVDIVYGGPPCQPFSTGGLRKAENDHRDMIPHYISVLETVKPYAFVMENVPGLLVKSRKDYFESVLFKLHKAGYKLSWRLMKAVDYGVPQKRKRLIIVGIRDKHFLFPKETHGDNLPLAHVPAKSVISYTPLGEVPDCPVVYARNPDVRKSPYAGHVYNGGGRPIDLDAPCHTVLASAGGYKTHWVDPEGIAVKYNEHLRSGGEPWEGAVPGARRMTIIESALIQTFPAEMVFSGKRSSQYTQIGDAVPPVLAEAIGRALVSQVNSEISSLEGYIEPEPMQSALF